MKKTIAAIAIIFLSTSVLGQYNLKTGSIININNANGDLSTITENQLLQCGQPISEGVITYMDCGFGSTRDDITGDCVVDAGPNEPFEIDYGLNEADNCIGRMGTNEWQGSHPIGFGTGDYSYPINNGITERTTFELECTPQVTNHNFSKVLSRGVVDIRNMIDSGRALAYLQNEMWITNLVTKESKLIPIKHRFEKSKANDAEFMIRQLGDTLFVIPVTDRNDLTVPSPELILKNNISTYLKITGSLPNNKDIATFENSTAMGICDSLSNDNSTSINIVTRKGQKGCYIDMNQPAYLVWYLLENEK